MTTPLEGKFICPTITYEEAQEILGGPIEPLSDEIFKQISVSVSSNEESEDDIELLLTADDAYDLIRVCKNLSDSGDSIANKVFEAMKKDPWP